MEKIRDAVKVVQPKSVKEPIGHSKIRIDDSKATKDVENDRVSVRIQTPVTTCAEVNTMAELHTKAIEINSADEVRQAVKAALTKKPMTVNQSVATEMMEFGPSMSKEVPLKEDPIRKPQEYKPESGDQIHVPQKSRKRQGKPTAAGPSKRPRTKAEVIDDFYVGKLCNLVPFTKKFSPSDLDSDQRPFMPRPSYGHIWKRFFAN